MKVKPMAVTAVAAAVASLLAQPAVSQEGGGLEEIVVTAARREQNLQDVPLAVVAFTGDNLVTQGIENMEDLNAVVPNVVIAGNNVGTDTAQFVMRGIPNVGTYIDGIWQVSNNGLLLREFVELERIEVLRGPQGTLYGRDSTGGAIRLYTKPPSDEYGAQVDMAIGNLDRRDIKGSLDLPFTDKFRSRFTIGSYDRDGYITSLTTGFKTGNYEDDVVRADFVWEPSDRVSVRFNAQEDEIVTNTARVQTWIENQLAWNSGFQMGLALAYDIASGGQWNCNYACAGWPGGQLGEWESRSEITVPSRQWLEQQTVDVRVAVTDSVDFQYLAGHTFNDSRTYNDWDSGQFNFYIDYFNTENEVLSNEFQLSGGGDRINWVGGLYLWEQQTRNRNPAWSMREWQEVSSYGQAQPFSYINQILTHPACTQATPASRGVSFAHLGLDPNSVNGWPVPCNAPTPIGWVGALAAGARPPAGDRLDGSDIDGWAAFGEVTVGITDSLDLTVGYRFHDQTEDQLTFAVTPGISAAKPLPTNVEWQSAGVYDGVLTGRQSVSFDADTYRLNLSWQLDDDKMVYFGYTEGFNSGGIDSYVDNVGPVQIAFDPESIENYEIGFRSDLAGGRLRFNATAFMTDWVDIQLFATVIDRLTGTEVTELVRQNAAAAEASGFEFELNYAATDKLLLQANLGLLDTKYTESKDLRVVTPATEFSRAPDETYNLGIQYDADTRNGGTLVTRFDANWTGAYWRSDTPSLRQNAYGVPRDYEAGEYWSYNARLSYAPSGKPWEVSLFGTNLSNEYIINSGFLHNIWQFDFATVDRPREVGVSMRMWF